MSFVYRRGSHSTTDIESGDYIHDDQTKEEDASRQRRSEVSLLVNDVLYTEAFEGNPDLGQINEGSETTFSVSTRKDSKPNSRSRVLVLHHDISEDAAIALRIIEDLTRNGICCVSHHLEYSEIREMGESDWLASSLLHCCCVLLICTEAFRDASLGICKSHFFVCQRLIAEALQRLSYAAPDNDTPTSFMNPIITMATDREFIPECMKDFEWFQLPSKNQNQWTELISAIRDKLPSVNETVEDESTESDVLIDDETEKGSNSPEQLQTSEARSLIQNSQQYIGEDSKPSSRSNVLILHHDNSEDAADALRIAEVLIRSGICCVSHHLDYPKIQELGERDWLASSLLHCYCVLLICTEAFREASLGTCKSHFFSCQRLIAEAVQRLSCVVRDGCVHKPSIGIFPIIKTAAHRTFIPECMKDLELFQLSAAENEYPYLQLISTIRQRHPIVHETETMEVHIVATIEHSLVWILCLVY